MKLDVKKKGEKIAYIPGAGDVIPEALEQIGYTVTEMSVSEISLENLDMKSFIIEFKEKIAVEEGITFRRKIDK